jgi:flavin-dependent dehydrogenase
MDSCDVLIVGGGPAGSSCAWSLRNSGLRIAILDKQVFPRHKVCGGWITPAVLDALQIEPAEYAQGSTLQPITGFRTSYIGGPEVETHYGEPISYGIRRFEFDDYLLQRCGASLLQGEALTHLARSGEEWIVNGRLRCGMLVGAGGTFCPVARFLGAKVSREIVVAAQEAEFEMDERQLSACSICGPEPELYFCSDMKGYGWCFRKQNLLNVGLGRLDQHQLSKHVGEFLKFLKAAGKLPLDAPPALGHAYLLFGVTPRNMVGEGVLLIGDAAGLAYPQSGEGIRPAVESGLLAGTVIAAAQGCYSRDRLDGYRTLLTERFGKSGTHSMTSIAGLLPTGLIGFVARRLLETSWFARTVVLDRWFLHSNEPSIDTFLQHMT